MKPQVLTVSCKLVVNPALASELEATVRAFAACCTWINETAPLSMTARFGIHKLTYHEARSRFKLPANLTCQAINRVAGNRKTAAQKKRPVKGFKPTSASFDERVFSFRETDWSVSLTILGRRVRIPLAVGDYQRHLLAGQNPTSATLFRRRNGTFWIQIQVEAKPDEPVAVTGALGVDLGRRDIARSSAGHQFSGEPITHVRDHFFNLRTTLQQKSGKGTRSRRRRCRLLLQRLAGRERRFQTWLNHTISRQLVEFARTHGLALAIEDLQGIRERLNSKPCSKTERRRTNSWAFGQLRTMLTYKCALAGVALVLVPPAWTSQTCHQCLQIGEREGKHFVCSNPVCQFEGDADFNAAGVIALLGAAVSQPGGPTLVCHYPRVRAAESSVLMIFDNQNR